ncbi:MAG: nitroreductase family protein [Firmicutes bacterium]|nr:nitroreductase family protein [Candidatus Colivicinus equi]
MNTIDCISNRHCYRGEYVVDEIPSRKDLTAIMEAGLSAPSGCNMQTTSLIAVDDRDIVKQIKSVIDPPIAQTAPAFICVLSQEIIAYRDKCYAVQDYAAAIENMLLTAVELGYQSCWYEGHITDKDRICDKIAKILNVPNEYNLVCILPIGKAKSEAKGPKKKDFKDRAWFNKFGE